MPLPPVPSPDKFVWMPASNGLFTVKNGYWFAHMLQASANASSSSNTRMLKLLKMTWRASIPPRLSLWAWQAIKGRMPTRSNLHRLGIVAGPTCPSCLQADETYAYPV